MIIKVALQLKLNLYSYFVIFKIHINIIIPTQMFLNKYLLSIDAISAILACRVCPHDVRACCSRVVVRASHDSRALIKLFISHEFVSYSIYNAP
jgi:hypothetical protein